jgi:condensin complex subunit 1
MVHLIWSKDTGSDESKGVRARLIECYRMLYLAPVTALSHKDNVNLIARRLIRYVVRQTITIHHIYGAIIV